MIKYSVFMDTILKILELEKKGKNRNEEEEKIEMR